MSLENVRAFYERLASDESFRTQLEGVGSKAECSQIVKNAGYDFTSEEFEEYTSQLLESSSDNQEMTDLNEKELEAVVGGASSLLSKPPIIHPMYGIVDWEWPRPQPMYGIITKEGLQ